MDDPDERLELAGVSRDRRPARGDRSDARRRSTRGRDERTEGESAVLPHPRVAKATSNRRALAPEASDVAEGPRIRPVHRLRGTCNPKGVATPERSNDRHTRGHPAAPGDSDSRRLSVAL